MAEKANKKQKTIIVIVIALATIISIGGLMLALAFPFIAYATAKVEVTDDISKYSEVIGPDAKDEYSHKWMNDDLFPAKIVEKHYVKDFKMVYYNPWDAQYLAYLVVDFGEEDYTKEIERLSTYGIDDYKGIYTVTGFTKYELVTMRSDDYNEFVYAITDKDNKRIIYVEIIFCNYFMDLDYEKYIDKDYLPDGFDAKMDNKYMEQKKHSN